MNSMSFAQRVLEGTERKIALSVFGFGGAPLGNMHRVLSDVEAHEAVQAAWDAGLRYFDTAPFYGHGLSESRMGSVLRQQPRDTYILSTKVGRVLEPCLPGQEESGIYLNTPPFRIRFDYSYDGVMRSYEDSLKRLGVDRIDILYVHDIGALTHSSQADDYFQTLLESGWRALDNLRSSGAVSAIGLGVNENAVCEQMLSATDPNIFLLAGRYTLLDQSAAMRLLPRCIERGVGIVLGGPYNSGILATGPIPNALYDYAPASPDILSRAVALQNVCEAHGVSLAEAALHFPLRHPAILSVIPGSQTAAQVALNVATFAKKPAEGLWADMKRAGLIDQT
jgi:D-threo-aldose 1-dehydrogenase